jgi:hypothetical protein
VEPISEGDYFQKNAEFATWLREGKGLFFSDLSSDQAHALFDSFVTVYNEGKMPGENTSFLCHLCVTYGRGLLMPLLSEIHDWPMH